MKTKFLSLLALAAMGVFISCDNDDDSTSTKEINPSTTQFIVASGDPSNDLTGGVAMRLFTDLETTKTNQSVYGNEESVKSLDGFTQYAYNPATGIYTGFIYARASSAQGIGEKQAGLRSYKIENGKLTELSNSPVKLENFGNTGHFGNYTYAAQISNPYVVRIDATGAGKTIELGLPTYAIDGINPSVSNIVDCGNNQVAMVLNYSNRDSAAVAFCDYDLNIQKVIYSNRIGTSVGAMRSVRYSQSGADDEGNIYVFSGSSATDSKVGALRIKKGKTEFDDSYYFNIFEQSDGYRFRKAFHISGDKFLLEFFLAKDSYANMSASGKLAVVDMSDKSLVWVTGLPDASTVSFGWGEGLNGNFYLPVAAATSMSGGGSGKGGGSGNWGGKGVSSRATESTVTPTIYRIDATTGVATAFMTFATTDLLKSINIIR